MLGLVSLCCIRKEQERVEFLGRSYWCMYVSQPHENAHVGVQVGGTSGIAAVARISPSV